MVDLKASYKIRGAQVQNWGSENAWYWFLEKDGMNLIPFATN